MPPHPCRPRVAAGRRARPGEQSRQRCEGAVDSESAYRSGLWQSADAGADIGVWRWLIVGGGTHDLAGVGRPGDAVGFLPWSKRGLGCWWTRLHSRLPCRRRRPHLEVGRRLEVSRRVRHQCHLQEVRRQRVAGAPTPMAASSAPAAPMGGGTGVPSAPVGPLPPFGSDVPRNAVAPPAAVSPATGPASAPPVSGGGSSVGGPVAPLPPGVVGSGVGASAGAASEGIRSSLPDPLLEAASQLVYQLLHDSRMYPYMDWCCRGVPYTVGFRDRHREQRWCGLYPSWGFRAPVGADAFCRSRADPEFRARWFSWANPAETMLAYAEFIAAKRSDVELWAVAVSTDHGGSSVPVRGAVLHFEDSRARHRLWPTRPRHRRWTRLMCTDWRRLILPCMPG